MHPLVLELTGCRDPDNTLEAKLSVFHSAAAALMFGKLTEHEYADAVVRDQTLIRLRERIQSMWANADWRAHSGSGIRGNLRIPYVVPWGRAHFRP